MSAEKRKLNRIEPISSRKILCRSPRERYCVDCPVPFRRKPVVSPLGGRLYCINSINCIFCIINHVCMRACVRSTRQVRPSIRPARRVPVRGIGLSGRGRAPPRSRHCAFHARSKGAEVRRGDGRNKAADRALRRKTRRYPPEKKMNGARPVALPR